MIAPAALALRVCLLVAVASCAGPRDASAPAAAPAVPIAPAAPTPRDAPADRPRPARPDAARPSRPGDAASEGGAAQGEACPDGKCRAGLRCLRYYGVAGASGPEFSSCEIPCMRPDDCPPGQTCGVIADGPGQVCRPKPGS